MRARAGGREDRSGAVADPRIVLQVNNFVDDPICLAQMLRAFLATCAAML
jgi:hypothetical protein